VEQTIGYWVHLRLISRIARLSFELGLAAIEPRSLTASRLRRLKLYKFDQLLYGFDITALSWASWPPPLAPAWGGPCVSRRWRPAVSCQFRGRPPRLLYGAFLGWGREIEVLDDSEGPDEGPHY
jgi:hypothetical protein